MTKTTNSFNPFSLAEDATLHENIDRILKAMPPFMSEQNVQELEEAALAGERIVSLLYFVPEGRPH